MSEDPNVIVGKKGEHRLKNTELIFPVVTGTVSFYLGKKATEFNSHKWTCYLRGVNDEDITHVVKKVTFQLHPSFPNPARVIEQPPFELTETGWGEFEISITLTFSEDAKEDDLELFHRLKLYADGESNQSNKKPVVTEQYEELIFHEPTAEFYNRVKAHQPVPGPTYSIAQYFMKFDEEVELRKLNTARQRVAQLKGTLQKQLESLPASEV